MEMAAVTGPISRMACFLRRAENNDKWNYHALPDAANAPPGPFAEGTRNAEIPTPPGGLRGRTDARIPVSSPAGATAPTPPAVTGTGSAASGSLHRETESHVRELVASVFGDDGSPGDDDIGITIRVTALEDHRARLGAIELTGREIARGFGRASRVRIGNGVRFLVGAASPETALLDHRSFKDAPCGHFSSRSHWPSRSCVTPVSPFASACLRSLH